jgi:hypothetical protein
MDGRVVARRLLEAAALVAPLAIGLLVPPRLLPRPLAFVLAKGWWLAAAGVAATVVAIALPSVRAGGAIGRAASWAVHGRRAWATLFLAGLLVAVLGLPGWRRVGPAGGDEPKYLRIARSLYRDLDAEVGSNQEGPLTAAGLAGNAQRLARSTGRAVASLLRGEHPPADHVWGLGNWTVAAWHGGEYHVHGPALPALLAPVVGPAGSEERVPVPRGALTVMALVFAVAFVQTARLAGELSGSRPAGALAASLVVLSPAVFVCGYHVYPDAVAAAAVPCIARHAWEGGPPPRPARAVALGLVAGIFQWLHIKLLPLGAASALVLGLRLRRSRSLTLLVAAVLVPTAGWLLYVHHLTGLVRPDALYVRVSSGVWRGAFLDIGWRFVGGLGNGLFGAREGIFVMVPVAAVADLDLTRDFPAGRSDPRGATLDLARAGLLLVPVAFWAWRFSREGGAVAPGPAARGRAASAWGAAVAFQLGAWLTLAATATALTALTALTGG